MNQANVKVSVLNFLSHSSSHSFSLSLDLLHFFHSVYLMPLYAFCFLFTQGFDGQGNLYKPIQHLIEDADVDITTAEELIQVKKDNSNDYKKPPHTILNEEEAEEIPVHGSEGGWVEMIQRSISRSEDLAVSFIFVGISFLVDFVYKSMISRICAFMDNGSTITIFGHVSYFILHLIFTRQQYSLVLMVNKFLWIKAHYYILKNYLFFLSVQHMMLTILDMLLLVL